MMVKDSRKLISENCFKTMKNTRYSIKNVLFEITKKFKNLNFNKV